MFISRLIFENNICSTARESDYWILYFRKKFMNRQNSLVCFWATDFDNSFRQM